jgi:hypothetical protein
MAKFIPKAELNLQRMTKQRDELVTALRACEALTAKRRDEITNYEIMAVRRIILSALAGVTPRLGEAAMKNIAPR